MSRYYLSRAVVSAVLGCVFGFAGSSWWMGVIARVIALALFVWAPRSGR